jgi:hypothetical protein
MVRIHPLVIMTSAAVVIRKATELYFIDMECLMRAPVHLHDPIHCARISWSLDAAALNYDYKCTRAFMRGTPEETCPRR